MESVKLIDKVINILSSKESLSKRYNLEIETLNAKKENWKKDKIRIGVIGVTSSGKSTLINSIIGDKLLSMAVKPSSSQLVICSYSEDKKAIISFENDKTIKFENENLTIEKLREYSDENYNFNNKERVKQIELYTPAFELGKDVLLIDSPGLDAYGLENHEQLTLESLLPNIDICLFVTTLKNNSDQKMKSILNLIAKYNYPTIIIQNMLDSVRPSVDGKKTEIEVAEEHKNRVKKIIQSSDIEDKNSVKIVQISAKKALDAIYKNNELSEPDRNKKFNESNYQQLIDTIKEVLINTRPDIENQRLKSISSRIEKIIDEAKQDIDSSNIMYEIKFEYEDLDKDILKKSKEVEERVLNLLEKIENSNKTIYRDYTQKDIDNIKNNVRFCENNIIKTISEFNHYLRSMANKLDIPPRDISSFNGCSNDIDLKLRTTIKTKRVKHPKKGFGGKLGRFFGNIIGNDDLGYEYKDEPYTAVDNIQTKREIERYIGILKNIYYREISNWTSNTKISIDKLISHIEEKRQAFEERKKSVIESKELAFAVEQLEKLIKEIKFESIIEYKSEFNEKNSNKIYLEKEFDMSTYGIVKMADNILTMMNRSINNLLLEYKSSINNQWIIISWDIISLSNFAKQYCRIIFDEKIFDEFEKSDYLKIDKYNFYYKPEIETIEKIKLINNDNKKNIYILTNASQYGAAQKQIYDSGILEIIFPKDFLAFVIQDFTELINGDGIRESIKNMMNITSDLNIIHDSFILIIHENPLYNLAIVECQINPIKTMKRETELINQIQMSFKYLRNEQIDRRISYIIRAMKIE